MVGQQPVVQAHVDLVPRDVGGQGTVLLVGGLVSSLLIALQIFGLVSTSPGEVLAVRAADLDDRARLPAGTIVAFEAHPEHATLQQIDGAGRDREYAIGILENPRVLVITARGTAQNRRLAGRWEQPAQPMEAMRFVGTLDDPGRLLHHSGFDPAWLARTADEMGLQSADELRLVQPSRDEPDRPLMLFLWIWIASMAALFWGGLFLTRARRRSMAEPLEAGDMTAREPWLAVVLPVATCGVYRPYWDYVGTRLLRRATGRADLIPALDLALMVGTLGLWGLYVVCRNALIADSLLNTRGHRAGGGAIVGLTLASVMCSLTMLAAVFKMQEAYNAVVAEAGAAPFDRPAATGRPRTSIPAVVAIALGLLLVAGGASVIAGRPGAAAAREVPRAVSLVAPLPMPTRPQATLVRSPCWPAACPIPTDRASVLAPLVDEIGALQVELVAPAAPGFRAAAVDRTMNALGIGIEPAVRAPGDTRPNDQAVLYWDQPVPGGAVTILNGTAALSPDREFRSLSLAVHPAAVAEPLVVMSALEAAMTFARARLGGELRFGEVTGPDALPSARATLVRDVERLRAAGVEPGSRPAYDLFGLDGRLRPDVPFEPVLPGSGEP